MNKNVRIEYSETFENLSNDLIDHLSQYSSEIKAITDVQNFIAKFESVVESHPYFCPQSQQLLNIGVSLFREYNSPKFKFRLLYRVMEDGNELVIIGDALLSQKQDLQQVLVDYCLLHK